MKPSATLGAGEPLTPDLLLRLQRDAGNQAVLRLLRGLRRQRAGSVDPQPMDNAIRGGTLSSGEVGTTPKSFALREFEEHSGPVQPLVRPEATSPAFETGSRKRRQPDRQTADHAIKRMPSIAEIDIALSPPRRHWLATLWWWLVWLLTFGLVDRRRPTSAHGGD